MQVRLRAIIIAAQCCFIFGTNYTMDEPQKAAEPKKVKKTQTAFGAFLGTISPELGKYIDGEQPAITNNPYKDRTGIVAHNPGISKDEKVFLNQRLPRVKAALQTILKRPLKDEQVPKISLICSGGGYRAMLYTTGALCGAKKIGLLDATTYITALSGSTWAVAPWISSDMPLEKFKPYIQECASKKFTEFTHNEKILVANAIAVKKIYNQPRTLVDAYGDCLGNRLLDCFGNLKQMIYLSDQAKYIADGAYPYPIYTAIDGREQIVDNQTWYEFTPHTVAEHINHTEIPIWSFGRKFEKGVSIDNAPEKPLAYILGTCGSAFAASLDDIDQEITHTVATNDEKQSIFDRFWGERLLPFYAEVRNPLYKVDNIAYATLTKEKHMQFVDAGLNANLPYPPVSGLCPERKADILIFIDISAGEIGGELTKAAAFAAKHKLPFPLTVEVCQGLKDLNKKTIHIFKDANNRACPVVIYMPRVSDPELWQTNKTKPEFKDFGLLGFNLDYETNHGYCSTIHFQYTFEGSTLVMNQAEFNIRANEEKLIQTINWVIDRQSK